MNLVINLRSLEEPISFKFWISLCLLYSISFYNCWKEKAESQDLGKVIVGESAVDLVEAISLALEMICS